MRMWLVQPRSMCRQHLLGEHLELHMFVGTIQRGHDVSGFLRKGLLKVSALERRHEELVREMSRRGYNHRTPLNAPYYDGPDGVVDADENWKELYRRCQECRRLIWKLYPECVEAWINDQERK